MSLTKVIRLNKAAREFNVGRETIVDFLEKKGFKIDTDPNTKLTPTMVDLLTAEFSMEKSVKEESRKIGLGSVKRETISLEDRKKPEQDPDDYDDDDDIIIRGMSVKIDDEFKRSLDTHQSHKKKTEQSVEEKLPEKAAESKPVEVEVKPIEEKVEIAPVVTKKEIEPEVIESKKTEQTPIEIIEPAIDKIDLKRAEQIESKKEKTPAEDTVKPAEDTVKDIPQEKIQEELPIAEPQPAAEQKTVPQVAEEKQEVAPFPITPGDELSEKKQHIPTEEKTKEIKSDDKNTEPKVLGMIDLSSINERTKPPRKTASEKRKEKEDRKKIGLKKQVIEEKTPEEKPAQGKDISPTETQLVEKTPVQIPVEISKTVSQKNPYDAQFLETKFEKLAGPNIVGRIELPVVKKLEKKKPVASSSDDKVKPKKKKRRRIKKDLPASAQGDTTTGVSNNTGTGTSGTNTGAGTAQRRTDNKPPDNRPKPPVKLVKGRKPRFEAKPELTEEQVQKQIKETLARLSGTGKSKTSKYRRQKRDQVHRQLEQDELQKIEDKKVITVAEFVTANELATMMAVAVTNVISVCMQLGLFVSINQRLDAETISLVAEEFGFSVKFESAETAIDLLDVVVDAPEDLEPRSPIVTVMGHVDHGKTKLLDYIRSANVVAGEAGGITQHIGAYEMILENGRKITFLDTPGHEAFTAMRARGAKVTDVAIIVVAADDSVMPQTVEAINHAQAANVPIVFAINKIDKPTANAERIKDQLSQMNILVEDWGGKFQSQEISAKAGLNIEELLEKVLLEAELLDLKANPNRHANGTIIESSLDKGRGYVSTLLVQNGTLKIGDLVLAGSHFGRVKAMYNERNQPVTIAGPSSPVLMLGMNGAPQAGDFFKVMKDEREAKVIASKRQQLQREQGLRTQKHITLDEIGRRIAIGDFKELNVIVKGDVDGSVEALSDSLLKQSTEEVQVNVIHKSVGPVTETDVMLASASNAIIIAFQVRPSVSARKLAEREQIDIRTYSIIYAAIEEIKSAIEGMLSPDIEEKIICNLEVRETFKITKVGTIAGCLVLDGTITRNTTVRLIREGIVLYSGRLGQLKRFKDDVKEVSSGYECGLNIENFNDIKIGDIIEGFEQIKVARKLA